MPRFNRLLITGAAGNLGQVLREGLATPMIRGSNLLVKLSAGLAILMMMAGTNNPKIEKVN